LGSIPTLTTNKFGTIFPEIYAAVPPIQKS
jgi:hypothetical protein